MVGGRSLLPENAGCCGGLDRARGADYTVWGTCVCVCAHARVFVDQDWGSEGECGGLLNWGRALAGISLFAERVRPLA